MDLFTLAYNQQLSPHNAFIEAPGSVDNNPSQDVSGFNPDTIFKKLALSDDLLIYTPRKENELLIKAHITPQSIFKKMRTNSPQRSTIHKGDKETAPQRRSVLKHEHLAKSEVLKSNSLAISKILCHTDEKIETNFEQKHDSLEMLPLDSNLVFINSSFNLFESSNKKLQIDDHHNQDLLVINAKKNLGKNFQNIAQIPGQKCNCKNTKCLKLYCECLRRGETCKDCNCTGCENHSHSTLRQDKMKNFQLINQKVFSSNIQDSLKQSQQGKGCNCRKSNCLKNYCECHQFGNYCSPLCKCTECFNTNVRTSVGQENEQSDFAIR